MSIPRAVEMVRARGTPLRWAVQRPSDARGTRAAHIEVSRARGTFVPREVDAPIDPRPAKSAPLVSTSARGRNVPWEIGPASAALGATRARERNGPRAVAVSSDRGRNVPREIGTASAALDDATDRGRNVPREIGTTSARGMSVRREIGSCRRTKVRKRAYFPSRADRLGSARAARGTHGRPLTSRRASRGGASASGRP